MSDNSGAFYDVITVVPDKVNPLATSGGYTRHIKKKMYIFSLTFRLSNPFAGLLRCHGRQTNKP